VKKSKKSARAKNASQSVALRRTLKRSVVVISQLGQMVSKKSKFSRKSLKFLLESLIFMIKK
jgi:hypothetical protein